MSLKSKGEWNFPKEKISDDIIKYLLEKREIEDIDGYLQPSLKDIPDSGKLYDSKRAAKEILESVEK